ncbi:MAG: hypothetical protein DBX91_04240 [Subdoligranulum variabile]|nr:MAG: hypothetical protein DBX91_04240 [Subdoligranulum variabile]
MLILHSFILTKAFIFVLMHRIFPQMLDTSQKEKLFYMTLTLKIFLMSIMTNISNVKIVLLLDFAQADAQSIL